MVSPPFLLLIYTLLVNSVVKSTDFPDLSRYSQPCEPFTCRPKRAPAPVKDFEFTANGCGTSGLQIAVSPEFKDCCNWHDACYSICGMPKAYCEKALQKCMSSKCNKIKDSSKQEECLSTAKIFYIGANMIACPAFQDAQKEACECVPTADAAAATRDRLVYFLEENGAPEADLDDEAIDALLTKYKGQEHIMFLRLLKKYPKALKINSQKANFMDDIFQETKAEIKNKKKKKKRKVKKEEEPVDEHEEL